MTCIALSSIRVLLSAALPHAMIVFSLSIDYFIVRLWLNVGVFLNNLLQDSS